MFVIVYVRPPPVKWVGLRASNQHPVTASVVIFDPEPGPGPVVRLPGRLEGVHSLREIGPFST